MRGAGTRLLASMLSAAAGAAAPLYGLDWPGRREGLTDRESEILALITQGKANSDVAALTYLKQDLIEYQVRLEGLEDDWRPSVSRDVRYTMLAPGAYRFEVRARLRPGTWSAPVSMPYAQILATQGLLPVSS